MPVAAAAANALKKRNKSSNSEVQVLRDKMIPLTIEFSIARGIILSHGTCNNIIILDLDMSSQLIGHSGQRINFLHSCKIWLGTGKQGRQFQY